MHVRRSQPLWTLAPAIPNVCLAVAADWEKYFLQPMHLIVLIAYCSFFISRYAVPARVSLPVFCFLVLLAQLDDCGDQRASAHG